MSDQDIGVILEDDPPVIVEIEETIVDVTLMDDPALTVEIQTEGPPGPPGPSGPTGPAGLQTAFATLATVSMIGIAAAQGFLATAGNQFPGDLGRAHYVARTTEPLHPGKQQLPDGRWAELDENVVTPEMFGAPGKTIDQMVGDAQAYLAARGGGVIDYGPKEYPFPNFITGAANNILHRGVRGATVWDFTALPWQNGTYSGFFRQFGTLGTPVALQTDSVKAGDYAIRIASATRSGTTVTATTEVAHNLTTGMWTWLIGDPRDPANDVQGSFFTVESRAVGKTFPAKVTVVSPMVFTYQTTASGLTNLTLLNRVHVAADIIEVADTSGFRVGDSLMVTSNALRTSGSTEQIPIGERVYVAKILSPTVIRLRSNVRDNYLKSDSARVVPVNGYSNVGFEGIEFRGKGANTGPGRGDQALMLFYTDKVSVKKCKFTFCDLTAVHLDNVVGFEVDGNEVVHDYFDQAGAVSNQIDIQYGFAYSGACQAGTFSNNVTYGGRHSIVGGGSPTCGVAREINITANWAYGTWLEAFSTHEENERTGYYFNHAIGCRGGINPRYSTDTIVVGNILDVQEYGVYFYNDVKNPTVCFNTIRSRVYPIRVYNLDNTDVGVLKIFSNQLIGGENSFYFQETRTGISRTPRIEFYDNTCVGSRYEAIWILVGVSTDPTSGWYGRCSGNTLIDCSQQSGRYWIRTNNPRGVSFDDNTFSGTPAVSPPAPYLMLVDGVGTQPCSFRNWRIASGLYTTAPIGLSDGISGHQTDMMPPQEVMIASDVATMKFAKDRILKLRGEGNVADNLTSVLGLEEGQEIIIQITSATWPITIKNGTLIRNTGGSDVLLDSPRDVVRYLWTNGQLVQSAALANN